jgi:hypothetical protein
MPGFIRRPIWLGLSAAALLLASATPAAAGGPPANDNFANATVITGGQLPYTHNDNAGAATTEASELVGSCNESSQSVWYRITPAKNITLRADTIGSDQEAVITVFRGTVLASLTELGCNDGANFAEGNARIAFKASAGVRYYLRLTSTGDDSVFHLAKVTPPSNDAFGGAKAVTSFPFSQATSNINATRQTGEPDPLTTSCALTGGTLWYRYKPAANTVVRADVTTADFDPWLAVYRGTSLSGLTLVDCNDDTNNTLPNVAFRAVVGQTYYVQVGGYAYASGNLTVRLRKGAGLANDNFAKAAAITADGSVHQIADTSKATTESGEPVASCAPHTSSSVWYKFTPSAGGTFDFVSSTSSTYTGIVSVFTGASLGSLTQQACGAKDVIFTGVVGTKYYIRVAGNFGDSGLLSFTLDES